ncbi:MAG: hypothetical protein F7B17_07810 [Desulfurococcales archaeon]|nr:hypothetical protein [Desulfurococcales archaeon]
MEGEVVKLGGSILKTLDSYVEAASRLTMIKEEVVAVVVSAARGVTDKILRACEDDLKAGLEVLEFYYAMASQLSPGLARRVSEVLAPLKKLNDDCKDNPWLQARMLSLGEAASRLIMVESLEHVGVKSMSVPATSVLEGYGYPLNARIDYLGSKTRLLSALRLAVSEKAVPVIEGFVASSDGRVVVLGRGGSDYTATAIASLAGARRVRLVTDVDGIYTADPRRVPGARVVESMGYLEALEASRMGAKKMHPRTFEPHRLFKPVEVLVGGWDKATRIHPKPYTAPPRVKLVASKPLGRLEVLALIGEGAPTPKVASRVLDALYSAGVSIKSLHAVSGRPSLTIMVDRGSSSKALEVLHSLVGV